MRNVFHKFVAGVAVAAVAGLFLAAEASAQTGPVILKQPAPIAVWPAKCDPATLQYVFPAKTDNKCGGKGVLVGPGWWWRGWPGLVSGGTHYLSFYDAPTTPNETSKAQFFPAITVPGYYDIWVSYRTTHNRANQVPFWILPDDGKTYKMIVAEKSTSDGFRAVKLGNFFLGRRTRSGARPVVEMRNDEGDHSKAVDGIFIKYTGPKNPSGVSASNGEYENTIELKWLHQAGVTSYNIYRSATTSVQEAVLIDTVPTSATLKTTLYTDTPPVKLQSYYYWVRSVGSLGKLAKGYGQMATGITGTVPAVPANVVAAAGATATDPVVITWNAVATATSYGIYRADTADGPKTHLGDVLATADPLQATDSAIEAGEDYHYFVTAKLAQMESGFSDRAEAIIP
jgi:hypothetical protein